MRIQESSYLTHRITAEHAQHIGQFGQMVQRIPAHGVFHMPDEIQIKEIFPGLAAQRPRFDLGQIEIAQRESAQRPEQRARQVARGENDSGLEALCAFRYQRIASRASASPAERSACKFSRSSSIDFFRIFAAIDLRGIRGCNRAGVRESFFHHHLDAAGSVVKRRSFNLRILFEKPPALIQSDRMRIDPPDLTRTSRRAAQSDCARSERKFRPESADRISADDRNFHARNHVKCSQSGSPRNDIFHLQPKQKPLRKFCIGTGMQSSPASWRAATWLNAPSSP